MTLDQRNQTEKTEKVCHQYLLDSFQVYFLALHVRKEFVDRFIEIFKFNKWLKFMLFEYHRVEFFIGD